MLDVLMCGNLFYYKNEFGEERLYGKFYYRNTDWKIKEFV
jgi:hypothetical protein